MSENLFLRRGCALIRLCALFQQYTAKRMITFQAGGIHNDKKIAKKLSFYQLFRVDHVQYEQL